VTIVGAALALLGAGCSNSKPGEKIVTPTPTKIVGNVPKPTTVVGNAAAGKPVFTANGCGACHTFTPAASNGKVGPDLDQLAEYAQKAGQPLADFTRSAIVAPPPSYVPPGYPNNVMPTTFSSLPPQQLADLVAFLTKSH
jgi:cytochrome c551/c552